MTRPACAAPASSWELVRQTQRGDREAFGELYQRYAGGVRHYLRARVADPDIADDFTNETFARAFQSVSSLDYRGRDVFAWFITIARNLVYDHFKSSRHRRELLTDQIAELVALDGGPEGAALREVLRRTIAAGLAGLTDDQRMCLTLRFWQGLTVAETAERMSRELGAVRALQYRAVRHLAGLVAEDLTDLA